MTPDQKKAQDCAFDALERGDIQAAFIYISEGITADTHDLGDLYLAGELALDLGLYQEAIGFMNRVIEISNSEKDFWYLEEAYVVRAYAWLKMGRHDLTQDDLTHIDDDAQVFWLKNHPVIDKKTLLSFMATAFNLTPKSSKNELR